MLVLYFHFRDWLYEYPLPSGNDRRIKLDLAEELEEGLGVIQLEVWDHVWHIMSGDETTFAINGKPVNDHILRDGDILNGYMKNQATAFAVTVHKIDSAYTTYEKFSLDGKDELVIGSDASADIIIDDAYVSRHHATLRRQGTQVVISDYSTNGTYVQNRRLDGEHHLDVMEVIYITGVKIVFLNDVLAINQAQKRTVNLPKYSHPKDVTPIEKEEGHLIRSPRMSESLDTEAVEVESPPAPQQQRRQPVIFTIGPALTMPLPILASVLFTSRTSGSNFMMGTLISVFLFAVVAAGWAIANVVYEKRMAKKDEEFRQKAYREYIAENETYLQQKHQKNAAILEGQHLSLAEIAAILPYNKAVLWNRNVNQPDFLAVRLGRGLVPVQCDIVAPKRRFSLVADPLQGEPYRLKEKYSLIEDAVSLLSLTEMKVVGVLGAKEKVRQIAGLIALQAAVLHCYTDLKMAFVIRTGEEKHYSWAFPLPHTRLKENKLRLICADDSQRQNVLFALNEILRPRMETQKDTSARIEQGRSLPHFLVFCTDPKLIARENLSRYAADEGDYGVTFILLYEVLDKLPNECCHIIQYDESFQGYYRIDQSRNPVNKVNFDRIEERLLFGLSCRVSGYKVLELASGEIPSSISFLEMYQVILIEEWDLLKRWKENRAYESLRALIGIGIGGKPLYLDIHEKQHGPHGLVAGTTGSGKSETIQTYILSLVMNFHPNEIALILIDYKGGGMANAFLGLPHLAGTITNLDGNQTIRALRSIKAEIKRRQTLFNQFDVNHIDNYSRYFREGIAKEPMPHLIIISDEFAELKKEQPEFIKELVSTARVGRSLGVHLILATQKPSGVVDDEIWSNSRFKICLRVQDKQDSNEMLHRTDAAYLTHTGRAYLQIGNDEIFELFQSGYSGAYYEPEDNSSEEEITMISLDGSPLLLRPKKTSALGENRPTQLSASVNFVATTAAAAGIEPVRPLWLPDLQEGISLADISAAYPVSSLPGLVACCGLIDNPSAQTQYGATINFSETGNLLVAGMPGSGKSTMIQTMLYSLAMQYPPQEVNFYCLDCSGMLTRVFVDLPHCGGVIGPDDSERVERLFQLIQELAKERAGLFEKALVGSYNEYRMVAEAPLPAILLVIDNLFAFAERYPDLVEGDLLSLSHTCVKYGIHLMVSVNHMSDVKYKLRQNFDQVLPLQLAERGDYHDALGIMPEFLPPACKGRGLWGKEALEYQAALAVKGENEQIRSEIMREAFAKLPPSDFRARKVRFIPKDQVYAEFLAAVGEPNSLCIGYNQADISIIRLPLDELYCYAVSGAGRKAVDNMLRNMQHMAESLHGKSYMVALKHTPDTLRSYEGVYRTGEELFHLLVLLKEEFSQRSALKKQYQDEVGEDVFTLIRERYGLLFIFIDSMNDFLNVIYETHEEDYYPLVELFFRQGKGFGVYFIAGFEPGVYGSNMFRDAYKYFTEHLAGIHLGGQLDRQKLYDIPFLSRDDMKVQAISEGITVLDEQFTNVFVPLNGL